MFSTGNPYSTLKQDRLKVKEWKKIYHTNINKKKAGINILISEKSDFRKKLTKRDTT